MTEDIVIISIICPECGEVLTEVHSDIIDDDLNIYFPSLTDKIDAYVEILRSSSDYNNVKEDIEETTESSEEDTESSQED